MDIVWLMAAIVFFGGCLGLIRLLADLKEED